MAGTEIQSTATVDYRGHALHGRRVAVTSERYAATWRGMPLGDLVDIETADGARYALPEGVLRRARRGAG